MDDEIMKGDYDRVIQAGVAARGQLEKVLKDLATLECDEGRADEIARLVKLIDRGTTVHAYSQGYTKASGGWAPDDE